MGPQYVLLLALSLALVRISVCLIDPISGKYVFSPSMGSLRVSLESAGNKLAQLAPPNMKFSEVTFPGIEPVNLLKTPDLPFLKQLPYIFDLDLNLDMAVASITSQLASLPISDVVAMAKNNPLLLAPLIQVGFVILAGAASLSMNKNEPVSESRRAETSAPMGNQKQDMYKEGDVYKTNGRYNPQDAQNYYVVRPVKVISRTLGIAAAAASFLGKLAVEFSRDKLFDYETELRLADELSDILTTLGPAFIKIGQSLSVRTDLLRPAYIVGLTKLQDRVPPFPTFVAKKVIASELGLMRGVEEVEEIFLGLKDDATVVAAASLGQVFKARVRMPPELDTETGMYGPATSEFYDVAIKVQRPEIVNSISLDLHIIRSVAPVLKKLAGLQSDLLEIIDQLGTGFVDELNYLKEAENAAVFMTSIKDTPLNGVVFAPEVLRDLSSEKVLVTKWVEGERLEAAPKEEIGRLCAVAMNTYLTMMLQCPQLHSDPHPGNLRRTPDGKLCIMDWGLVTAVAPDLQLTYIEHIAHLVSKDYAAVPSDLVKLGFIGEGMEEQAMRQGVVTVLADIYGSWAQGGGAAKVDVANVVSQLSGLTEEYGNFFRLPPYFAYIARAFGVLEGIGLQADPDYAIVGECLPYIASRLVDGSGVKDPSNAARMRSALESFVYGKDKAADNRVFDAERLRLLISGIGAYNEVTGTTSATASELNIKPTPVSPQLLPPRHRYNKVQAVEEVSDQVAALVLDGLAISEPSPVQQLLLDELAKIVGAFSRKQWSNLMAASGTTVGGRTRLGTLVDPLGLFSTTALVNVDENDERILQATRTLLLALQQQQPTGAPSGPSVTSLVKGFTNQELRDVAVSLTKKLWHRRDDVGALTRLFAQSMLRQASSRLISQ